MCICVHLMSHFDYPLQHMHLAFPRDLVISSAVSHADVLCVDDTCGVELSHCHETHGM